MGRQRPSAGPAEAAEREAAQTAKLEQLHATLTEQVAAIRDGEDWQRWLKVAATFPTYSLNNMLLIAAQRPDATAVAGFGAWKALGRQVDRGSKGIAILAPMARRPSEGPRPAEEVSGTGLPAAGVGRAAGGSDAQAGAGPAELDKSDPSGPRRGVAGFKVVHVFDVSQTSGQPLPERPVPVLLAGQAPPGLWDALAAQVQARDFQLRRGDCGNANGLTDYIERSVTVRADVDDAQAVKTLAHELGHVLLHDPTGLATVTAPGTPLVAGDPVLTPEPVGTSVGQCRGRLEVEAESVAYLVASAHGLDTGAYTFSYVVGWASEVAGVEIDQVVRGTANRVLAATKVVLTGTAQLLGQTSEALVGDQDLALQADAPYSAQPSAAPVSSKQPSVQDAGPVPAVVTPAQVIAAAKRTAAAWTGPTPERLVEVHALAVDFYTCRLQEGGPEASRAVALLAARGVDRDAATTARVGYAPRAWTSLVDYLRRAGVDDDALRASGLVVEGPRENLLDRFRDRLIFPIDTLAGHPVALLGRAVDETARGRDGTPVPKYLNSPATAIYRKGEHLYGLGHNAARAVELCAKPVIVEGPMDVLAINRAEAFAAGDSPAHYAVAPCGTALTTQQVQLLDVLTGGLAGRGVVTAFDGDDAGRRASLRAYHQLRQVEAWPTTLVLPDGQDPASFAAEMGGGRLRAALLATADQPLADLVVDEQIRRHDLNWPEGQVTAGRAASVIVASMPPEHVSRQIGRVAAQIGLDVGTVADLVVAAATSPTGSRSTGAADARPPLPKLHRPAGAPGAVAVPPPPTTARTLTGPAQSAPKQARAGFPDALQGGRPPRSEPRSAPGLGSAPRWSGSTAPTRLGSGTGVRCRRISRSSWLRV